MYFKIVFLLLILSSITNSENASADTPLGNLKSTDQEKASDIEEGELTNEDNSTTTMALPPEFEVEVATVPSPPETPTKPVESKDSEQTPDDKQKPNPDPKPEDKKEENKEENKEDAKPGSNDPPKEPIKDETKPEPETPEKPNEKKEPETPAPKQPEKASRTGLKKGSVWGIAIGVIGMVATTGFLVVYILKRRRGDDRLIR